MRCRIMLAKRRAIGEGASALAAAVGHELFSRLTSCPHRWSRAACKSSYPGARTPNGRVGQRAADKPLAPRLSKTCGRHRRGTHKACSTSLLDWHASKISCSMRRRRCRHPCQRPPFSASRGSASGVPRSSTALIRSTAVRALPVVQLLF
jgi:hypothetical protein